MAPTKRARRIDRISDLPEPILCHILSFLPTKTAVACSILSKKWQFLWTSLPSLDFDNFQKPNEETFDDLEPEVTFVHFVYRVLLLRKEWGVKKFRLRVESHSTGDAFHVESWVCAAVARGVEELDISFSEFSFPRSLLFSCNKLQVLKLNNTYFWVESCHFPSLKVLHLSGVEFDYKDYDSFQNFLSGCPVLEEMILKSSEFSDDLRICVPTLTSLVVEFEIFPPSSNYGWGRRSPVLNVPSMELELDTPALEYLSFKLHPSKHTLVATNICKLAKVEVDSRAHDQEIADKSLESGVAKLLSTLSSVKFLNLSWNTMRVLAYSSFNNLSVFCNLFRVELHVRSSDWVVLEHLLEKFHNLKSLVIVKELGHKVGETCWKDPLRVPNCLSVHLVAFRFQGFEGLKAEKEFIKYVMKSSMVLKNVTISASSSFKSRTHVLQEFLMAPRGSKACQLQLN